MPADVVRMGSHVHCRTGDGNERELELVYPADADIDCGRISVMTPIGTALIGLASGQSITWQTRRLQTLTVLSVDQSAAVSVDTSQHRQPSVKPRETPNSVFVGARFLLRTRQSRCGAEI